MIKQEKLSISGSYDETSLINNFQIFFGILLGPIAFRVLTDLMIFLSSTSSVELRGK